MDKASNLLFFVNFQTPPHEASFGTFDRVAITLGYHIGRFIATSKGIQEVALIWLSQFRVL